MIIRVEVTFDVEVVAGETPADTAMKVVMSIAPIAQNGLAMIDMNPEPTEPLAEYADRKAAALGMIRANSQNRSQN